MQSSGPAQLWTIAGLTRVVWTETDQTPVHEELR